ncbi:MAG: exodeoxyribonuclease V subunit gamma, partial [Abditibacteriota bacterium]|nr:exodeoxyribonuclease V subunit gamma [Abditibacteriota bacterium]
EKDPKTVIRKSFGAADGNIEDKIRIIPCPGPEREAEAVWSCVCHDLSRKDGEGHHLYSPEDILVLVCDPAKYYPHMERVFGRRETNGGKTVSVPFNLTCVRPGPVSSYLDGVAALFDLMGSRMERFRMEKLFTNPCFLSRRGLEYGEVEDWLKRIEDCGVWEGFEAEPGADPLHTWKHAGRRFRLAEASGESWGGMTPPDGRPGKKDDALLALAELLREELCRLAALDAKDRKDMDANDAKETADRVFDGVLTLLEGWLTPDKKEAGMAGYVADRLNKFRKQCETRNYVPYIRDLRYFLEITAEPMQFEHGQPFTGGVMTGHIKNITFPACKALYLLGFNEDNFPGRDDASSLDLTGEGRVTQTDLNRFAFLRAVLWATDKVYITYDCKDRVKNTERFPSSCVRDLEELLDIKEEETLSLFARTDVNKGKEWTAPCHGEDLEEARALNVKKTQNTENNDEDSQQGSGGQTGNNVSGEEGPQGAAELTINRIRDFLLDPGDYYLSYVLGIADFDRDRRSRDFIPPATDAKDKWRYERPAYLACAKDKQAAAGDSYDSEYRQQGRAPEGPLADIERTLLEQDKAFDRIRNYEGSAEKVPLRLTTEQSGMEVTVTGEAHIFESEEEVRVFVPKKIGELRHRIEAWVTGAVYLLSRDPGKPVRICGTDKEYLLVCGAEDQKVDIKSRLAGVCGALTGLTSFYSAPAELVSDLAKDIAEANAPAPEENDAKTGDGSANDTEKTADKKQIVSERLRELIAADMAKIKKGYQPTHYWHTLLKEHPDRLVLPGWEELSAAAERLRPILELKEQKNK